jgi:hypothetical protein
MSLMMALQRVTEDTRSDRLVPGEGFVQVQGADALSAELFPTSSAHKWLIVVVRAVMPPKMLAFCKCPVTFTAGFDSRSRSISGLRHGTCCAKTCTMGTVIHSMFLIACRRRRMGGGRG